MADLNRDNFTESFLYDNKIKIGLYYLTTTSNLTFILAAVALTQFWYFLKYYYKTKVGENNGETRVLGLDDIPGPKFFWPNFIGCIPKLLPCSNTLSQGYEWYLKYPGMFKTTGAGRTFVALTNGPLVQQLFQSGDFGHGVKSPLLYDFMKPFITNGVLVSTGKFWQAQRKILMKSQSFKNLIAYIGMLNKQSEIFVGELENIFEDGQPHQIAEAINILFLTVVWEIITGFNEESIQINTYNQNFQIWKESHLKQLINPLWKLHPMAKHVNKAIGEMNEFARVRLARLKEMRERDEDVHFKNSTFRSVLDDLLDAGVEDDQIVEEMNTMMFGGHETGATTMHFFCYCIALNPEIQDVCRREVDELFENPDNFKNGSITYEALQSNLRYVERCILETLRLFPPVYIYLRELKSPLRLDHENKIYELPVGVNVVLCPFTMHRDPIIFPEPEKFGPDRFLPDEMAKRHAYSHIPFSGGPRNCPGQKFAMIEIKIIAAYLLRRFEMRTTDKMEDIPLQPFATLTPKRDYIFQLKKRQLV